MKSMRKIFGFGMHPEIMIAAMFTIVVVITVITIVADDTSTTLGVRITKHIGPLFGLVVLVGIPLALAWCWHRFTEFRKWQMGPESALRELRRWYLTPAERLPPGGPLAMMSALTDLRVNAAVDGETALHWALNPVVQLRLHKDLEPVVERLLAAGANPNARDRTGSTALHLAVESFAPRSVIERLLAAGADPTIANGLGGTPLGAVEFWDNGRGLADVLREAARSHVQVETPASGKKEEAHSVATSLNGEGHSAGRVRVIVSGVFHGFVKWLFRALAAFFAFLALSAFILTIVEHSGDGNAELLSGLVQSMMLGLVAWIIWLGSKRAGFYQNEGRDSGEL